MDFSRAKILCLGDLMLDRFAYCDTERISPEAPVPVLLLRRTQSMLCGAGNVARNIAALGGTAVPIGLLDRTRPWPRRGHCLLPLRASVDRHVASAARPTTCKIRYLAGTSNRRVDEEHTYALRPDEQAALIDAVRRRRRGADAAILSDYGKGYLRPAVPQAAIGACARRHGVPVYVDPKGDDFAP